jgi:hypothetical protein
MQSMEKIIQKYLKFLVWLLVRLCGLNARWKRYLIFSLAIARTARNCSHQKPNYLNCESQILRFIYMQESNQHYSINTWAEQKTSVFYQLLNSCCCFLPAILTDGN